MSQAQKSIITHVEAPLQQMENAVLRDALLESFNEMSGELAAIEESFRQQTDSDFGNDEYKRFFHSWSLTNHSCMRVSAISNRLSLMRHDAKEGVDPVKLLDAITSLNRIADEDLGVGGGELHHDMFYRMATRICGGSDDWLKRDYCTAEASEFKRWTNRNALRDKDILVGLLMTVIHEIYTHGEVEFLQPLFYQWLIDDKGYTEKQSQSTVFWITAHRFPVEVNHFHYGVKAVEKYCEAFGVDLGEYAPLKDIFRNYLAQKAKVMGSLTAQLAAA